jgi:MFS family permease
MAPEARIAIHVSPNDRLAQAVLRSGGVGFVPSPHGRRLSASPAIRSEAMDIQFRHPIRLRAARPPGARTFAILYGLESFARASVSSLIPIQAFDLLRDEQRVSLLYTIVSLVGLAGTLLIPLLIARLPRRWVYSLGVCLLIVASLAFISASLPGQVAGMIARASAANLLSITLNLYIMDHIRKTDFVAAESLRMAWSTLGWMGGPVLGVFLYTRFGIAAAHGMVIAFASALLLSFWYFRLTDNPLIRPGRSRPASPLANIGRFLAQPRLRLAWLIAFGRSCFWTTFFVYGSILMVVTGQGKLAGGMLVSAGNAMLFTAIVWGWIAGRFGARATIAFSFVTMAVSLVGAGAAGEAYPLLAGSFLLAGAFFCISLDALGSAAFLRAVRARERAEMTAVYRTYLDLSDLLPPLVYAIVLAFFGLGAVFVALGLFSLLCGWLSWRYLPKSF